MTFKTTLFQALAAADLAFCNGQRVVAKLIRANTALRPFVDLEDGSTLYLQDAEIAIDEDGRAYSEHPDSADAVVWCFKAMQPITAKCVVPLPRPQPVKAGELVSRLRQIEARSDRRRYG